MKALFTKKSLNAALFVLAAVLPVISSCKKEDSPAPAQPVYILSYLDPGAACDSKNYIHFKLSSGKEYVFEEGVTGRYNAHFSVCAGHAFNVSTFYDSLRYQVTGGQEVASIYFLVDKPYITTANYRIGSFCGGITGMQFEYLPVDTVPYWRASLVKKLDTDYFRITRVDGNRYCGEFRSGTTELTGEVIEGDFSVMLK